MKIKISKRDVLFFFIGVFTVILLNIVLDWKNEVKDFERGFNDAQNEQSIK